MRHSSFLIQINGLHLATISYYQIIVILLKIIRYSLTLVFKYYMWTFQRSSWHFNATVIFAAASRLMKSINGGAAKHLITEILNVPSNDLFTFN